MRAISGLYLSAILISAGAYSPALAGNSPHQAGHAKLADELHPFNQALTVDTRYQPSQDLDDSDDADPERPNPANVLVSSLLLSILFLGAVLYGFKQIQQKSAAN